MARGVKGERGGRSPPAGGAGWLLGARAAPAVEEDEVAMEDGVADEVDEEEQLVRKQRREKKELQGERLWGGGGPRLLPRGPVGAPLSSSAAPEESPHHPLPSSGVPSRAPRECRGV